MSFPLDTPIGLLPYAISPNGEVNFLFWKASSTTPQHSSTLFGHCIGVKTRYDQSMWDVCARTWAECSGGLFAISEELRNRREKKEKKRLKELKTSDPPTNLKDIKKIVKKADKMDKQDESTKSLSSILSHIATQPPQQNTKSFNEFRFYSPDSKTFQNFENIYKIQTQAQLIYNATKTVRKLLTARKSGTITLTNDNPLKPEFVYCVQVEYMPLWMINYLLQDNGNGSCMWVNGHDLIRYITLQHLSNIPTDWITTVSSSTTIQGEQSLVMNGIEQFKQEQKASNNTAQVTTIDQLDCILPEQASWQALVNANKTTTPESDIKEAVKKIVITSQSQCTDQMQIDLLHQHLSHSIPINLSLLSVLTVDSLVKLTNLCNTSASTAQSSPLTEDITKVPLQYQLPTHLIQYNQECILAKSTEYDSEAGKPKVIFTPSQRQQFTLDLSQSSGYYKCRQCRNVLFATTHLASHEKFDLDQHFEKAQLKHFQQQNSGLQGLKKSARDKKGVTQRADKELRKYLLIRKHQSEVAIYDAGDGDDDDMFFYDEDEDEDENEDLDQDGEIIDDFDDEVQMYDLDQFKTMNDNEGSDEGSDDGIDYTRLIIEPKYLDIPLLLSFQDCVNWTNAQAGNDDDDDDLDIDPREAALRHQFLLEFREYQETLQKYLTEKASLEEQQASISAPSEQQDPNDDGKAIDLNPTRGNFAETKGNGVFVKPVFGKASAKGFTGAIDGVCQSVFLEGSCEYLPPTLLPMNQGAGDIVCKNCNYRCGNYSWSGTQCSCGKWVVPGLQIPLSKVDFSALDKKKFNLDIAVDPTMNPPPVVSSPQPPHSTAIPAPFGSTTNLPTGVPTTIVGARRLQAVRPPVKKPTPS